MENLETSSVPLGRFSQKGHYDQRFVKQVVQEIEEGLPLRAASIKYGIRKTTMYSWIERHSSAAHIQPRKKPASIQIKRSLVRAINSGRMTIKEAETAQGVNRCTIMRWLSTYIGENDDIPNSNLPELTKKKNENIPVQVDVLPKTLQAQLDYANLKIAALNTLIDVAEEQLKINIRKKPGTRQL
jgi:transposase-like protein